MGKKIKDETFSSRFIAGWVEFVEKPTKYRHWQVKIKPLGSYPKTVSSFDNERDAQLRLRKIKKDLRKVLV